MLNGRCKPVATPIEKGLFHSESFNKKLNEKEPYREAIGGLLYMTVVSCPISFAFNSMDHIEFVGNLGNLDIDYQEVKIA